MWAYVGTCRDKMAVVAVVAGTDLGSLRRKKKKKKNEEVKKK